MNVRDSHHDRIGRRWLSIVCVALVVLAGQASAHGGETTGPHDLPLAVTLFVGGTALTGASVYLDATRDVDRRHADVGVFIGLAVGLLGIAAYWL